MVVLNEKPTSHSPAPPKTHTFGSRENINLPNLPPALHLAEEKFTPPSVDFDPCQNAKPCSPFYDHDTPRASTEYFSRPKTSFALSVHDVEAQNGLTPSASRLVDGKSSTCASGDASAGPPIKTWTSAMGIIRTTSRPQCMTKPKRKRLECYSNLSKKQKLLVKLLIALVVIGAVVGIGVGISIRVGGGVYKNENSTSEIVKPSK